MFLIATDSMEKNLQVAARIFVAMNVIVLTLCIVFYKLNLELWDRFRDDIGLTLALCFFVLLGLGIAISRSLNTSKALITKKNAVGAALVIVDGLLLLILGAGQ